MSSIARCAPQRSRTCRAACFIAAALVEGCGGNQTAEQALDRQFQQHPEFKKATLAKFSGRVTVDGMPPAKEAQVFVILFNLQHLERPRTARRPSYSPSVTPRENSLSARIWPGMEWSRGNMW